MAYCLNISIYKYAWLEITLFLAEGRIHEINFDIMELSSHTNPG